MSLEKTEKATPRRREDARKKGQIARGPELPGTLAFIGALIAFKFVSSDLWETIGYYIRSSALSITKPANLTDTDVTVMFFNGGKVLALLALPVLVVAFAGVLAGNFAQGGFSLTPEALTPKPDRYNPAKNIKKIFGTDSLFNLGKSSVKLLVICVVAYGVLMPVFEGAPLLIHASLPTVAVKLGETLFTLAMRCGLVLLVLAGADYGYAWYKHEKSLKMSKQDIRDEFKQQEGDPMIKGQRRRSARALLQKRSLAAVPTASVVITNPTHFAVALRYDRDKDAAPIVVAKGADHIAAKIRLIARDNDVPLIENPPLARALYSSVEPNQIIPVEFFSAIAEVLAYVFRLKEA